jgi:MFS transporter, FSR family, fosmidomycin resistance protein
VARAHGPSGPDGRLAGVTDQADPRVERPVRPALSLVLLSFQHALIHGQAALYPIVFIAISAEFAVGAEAIAVLAAVGAILTGSIQLTFGALTRRFSRRSLLGVGGVFLGAATAAQAATPGFASFAVVNVASKLGGAPQHPVGNALLTEQWPRRRWGTAISAHIAGGNVGTLVMGVIATLLVSRIGWRGAVVAVGVVASLTGLLILWLVREARSTAEADAARPTVRDAYRRVLASRDLRWLFLSSVLGGGARGLGVLNVFVPLYLVKVVGVDDGTLGAMYAVLLAASVPGPLVAGWLSDRVGRKPLIVAVYLAGAVGLAWFVIAGSSIALLWTAIVVLSLFSFVESPQLQALLADISPAPVRDAAYSTYFALAFGVGSMWGLVYGAVIALAGESQGLGLVFVIMAVANVAAALTVLPIRLAHR